MTDGLARYIGTWELLPELSLYAAGTPPASGTYEISREASGALTLRVTWRMPDDTSDRSTIFGGPADGSPVALPTAPAGADAFTLTHVNQDTLDSAGLRAGETIAYARRVVSADGSLLAVLQEVVKPDGQKIRNFQVYRRA